MCAQYPIVDTGKRRRAAVALPAGSSLDRMALWLLMLVVSPTPSASHLVVTLAVVAVAVLILAAAVGLLLPVRPPSLALPGRRTAPPVLPRLADPDAAGRPRPRAPSAHPTAA